MGDIDRMKIPSSLGRRLLTKEKKQSKDGRTQKSKEELILKLLKI